MEFGLVGLEGLVGTEAHSQASDTETKGKSLGSGFNKLERSGSAEERLNSKMMKTESVSGTKTMPLHQGTPLLRSNFLLSGDGRQQEQMLSFSSSKSEAPFLSKDGGLTGRNAQSSIFSYYQQKPPACNRSAGYGSGSVSAGMHGPFAEARGPFTPSQWTELEQQALIYKYLCANVSVPSHLLISLKKPLYSFGLSNSSAGYLSTNSSWGSFHLGFSSNTDPEPGRCRRTDGKKWRCSRDAVADQKYCEKHMNRGRHRSRKPVEGQTGQAASGTTNPKVVPMNSPVSVSVMPGNGASNSLAMMQNQFKSLQPSGAANQSAETLFTRSHNKDNLYGEVQEQRDLSMMSSTINLMPNECSAAMVKQEMPLEESSLLGFGIVSSESLLNPSHKNSFMNTKSYDSFLDFNDQGTPDQHSLRQFMDDWPKDHSGRTAITWPDELKSDWTQLSMSIPATASDFSSSTSSPAQEKLALSPLRLSRELEPMQMNLGINTDLNEQAQKRANRMPISWASSLGGPLGEVLKTSSCCMKGCKTSQSLNLLNEGWDGSPQLGSSPTGVLQKATFCSRSNSSSGSSPRADTRKTLDRSSVYDDVLGSTFASSSVPSL